MPLPQYVGFAPDIGIQSVLILGTLFNAAISPHAQLSRVLYLDLEITHKVLAKWTREASVAELLHFEHMLSMWYLFPEQLVFMDQVTDNGDVLHR